MPETHHDELHTKVMAAMRFADWVYHDVRLDCDGHADERFVERLSELNELYGVDGVFGVAAAWSVRTYFRLEKAMRRQGLNRRPTIMPQIPDEEPENDEERQQKRAYITGQQFMSAVSRDDMEMAESIFNAAYSDSVDETMHLLYTILMLSIEISNQANSVR